MCTGNICRSPAAEAVFRNLVSKRGLESKFHIDSAGTIGYHEVVVCIYLAHLYIYSVQWWYQHWRGVTWIQGNKADSRMRSASKKRGIEVTSISRPIKPSDFRDFDLILAMDRQNYGSLSVALFVFQNLSVFVDVLLLDALLFWEICRRYIELIWEMETQGAPPRQCTQ